MFRLAYRNLFQSRARLTISVAGVALALALILALDAILAGVERQLTAYIDRSGADLFVSQSGVRTMHMASSALPASLVDEIRTVPGVELATPILYLTNMIGSGQERYLAYIIGLPPDAAAGKPWKVEGTAIPGPGQAVIDRDVADRSGVRLGGTVGILGRDFTVSGLAEGTATLMNSIAFISLEDFARLRGDTGGQPGRTSVVSYVLVKVRPGGDAGAVATRIQMAVPGVTVQRRAEFSHQERKIVKDMSTDIIAIMNTVGFLIGLAVMGLTVYTATFSRRREYGILKALGARNSDLYRAVIAQAFDSVALGFAAGLAFTVALGAAVSWLGTGLALDVTGPSLLKVGALSLAIAGLSAALPVRQIAGLDPAMVFRGK